MAILKKVDYEFKSKTGEVVRFISEVRVNSSGYFTITVPEQCIDTAKGMMYSFNSISITKLRSVSISKLRKNWVIGSASLDSCRDFIKVVYDEIVSCKVSHELIIAYGFSSRVAYVKSESNPGKIYSNGSGTPDYQWLGGLGKSSMDYTKFYSVGLVAKVMRKTIYRSSNTEKIEYESAGTNGTIINDKVIKCEYIGKLNSFVRLRCPEPGKEDIREMPYSVEAAKFFYEAIMNVCKLADRLATFFSDDQNITRAIEAKTNLLEYKKEGV